MQIFKGEPSFGAFNRQIEDKSIDVGLSIHSQFMVNDNYTYIPLVKERLYALLLPDHPLAKNRSISVKTLSNEHIILMRKEKEYETHIRSLLTYHGVEMKKIIYTDHIDTVIMTMEETNGLFLGTRMLKGLPRNDIVFVDIDPKDFYIDISLIFRANNSNPAISGMLDCRKDLNIGSTRFASRL